LAVAGVLRPFFTLHQTSRASSQIAFAFRVTPELLVRGNRLVGAIGLIGLFPTRGTNAIGGIARADFEAFAPLRCARYNPLPSSRALAPR
jgi:hypothetical protein